MVFNDIAQICLNGHIINAASKTYPQLNKKYCDQCGSPTITKCPRCETEIEGQVDPEGKWGGDIPTFTSPPAYCPNCGKPFPWTEAKIKAARDLFQELEDISDKERRIISQNIDDLIKDTPNTELAATKVKKIISKTGKTSLELFKRIMIDLITDKAREILGLW